MTRDPNRGGRWLALFALCLGLLMTILDATIVTVALPSIVTDLGIVDTALTWMINAYALTFGGSLLLSGRLGDLFGRRRVFLAGITIFTLASLTCGLAPTQPALLIGRGMQGLGSAAVMAVGLSIIADLFPLETDRVRAMGLYGFACAAGGTAGQLLGGFLVEWMSWHWIFLVNLPVGIVVFLLCFTLLPRRIVQQHAPRQIDIAGAITVSLAATLGIYALANISKVGWASIQTAGLLGMSGILLLVFLIIEHRVAEPLMPLRLFRARNFATANLVGALWTGGAVAWSVIATLYLQRVLGYQPFYAGLAFAPATIITGLFSGGLSGMVLMRFGTRAPLAVGLLFSAAGMALFARAPYVGTFVTDVLPAMLLLGLGGGMAAAPLLVIAVKDLDSADSGLASGVLNTSWLMGGALGLAVLTSLAEMRTASLQLSGTQALAALNGGYHLAFLIGAIFNVTAAGVSALMLRSCGPPQKIDLTICTDSQEQDVTHSFIRLPE